MMTIIIFTLLSLLFLFLVVDILIIKRPVYGGKISGQRLERVKQSPNYHDGQFHNLNDKPIMNAKPKQFVKTLRTFLFGKKQGLRPATPLEMVKRDLKRLPNDKNLYIWFGHSSYMLSLHGSTFLVDPTFKTAAPFSFINKPFKGTTSYKLEDLPNEIDYLIITHDHYDHLDYKTVKPLRKRIKHVICPLGVGAHFERWGYEKIQLTELDWNESANPSDRLRVYCLPSQHFSGRALHRNNTLWASFMLKTPYGNIFIGGDGGYGPHFKQIGEQYPDIDLAILENGQYNEQWKHIHTLPEQLGMVAVDLKARKIITVHHSKYTLSTHPWDEPLQNELKVREQHHLNLLVAPLGEICEL